MRTIVIKTPEDIRQHFKSNEHSCEYLAWREREHGVTAHFVCCDSHMKNISPLVILSWAELHPSWKDQTAQDFVGVIKLLCSVLVKRIRRTAWNNFLDSFDGHKCHMEDPHWDESDLGIGAKDEFDNYSVEEIRNLVTGF